LNTPKGCILCIDCPMLACFDMPLIIDTSFKPFLSNPWLQTLLPKYFANSSIKYSRERVDLADGDFIDLDFSLSSKSNEIVLLVHGFEGNSLSAYMIATAKYLNNNGHNVVAMNLRGCSGEDNTKPYSYHSGKTGDLREVIEYLVLKYDKIFLVGYSLGANLVLKYLADFAENALLKKAIAISAPFDLEKSANKITKLKLVDNNFLKTLIPKISNKKKRFSDELQYLDIGKLKSIVEVDEYYTAKLHGFASASAYYSYASCGQYLQAIKTPTLVINSLDDPMLCHMPEVEEIALNHEYVSLLLTQRGGHVGFVNNDFTIFYHKKIQDFFF
jgi:uncharacterized protein